MTRQRGNADRKRAEVRAIAAAKGVGCKGWNYHVWPLGSDRCSMCGKTKSEVGGEGDG